ncbi:MAG: gamma carbonic anhydrase family protein [Bdellovibrionales bacterium]|nr:gamma carbonic anhydrase family protein [Bdellovibrionales bacterium]
MPTLSFQGKTPRIGSGVFIAPTAWVIGDVEIGDNCSIFFGAVLRGDINPIVLGSRVNVQEHAILHTSRGIGPCVLEDEVTVGHGAVLHGCLVKRGALIGMNATVLDQAEVGVNAMVAAQACVTMKTCIPDNMLAAGVPAKVLRPASEKERAFIDSGVQHYAHLSQEYLKAFSEL